ncbi:MAG: hypothetical protein MHM6MM_000466 [Cercozoa sp. M6MM]
MSVVLGKRRRRHADADEQHSVHLLPAHSFLYFRFRADSFRDSAQADVDLLDFAPKDRDLELILGHTKLDLEPSEEGVQVAEFVCVRALRFLRVDLHTASLRELLEQSHADAACSGVSLLLRSERRSLLRLVDRDKGKASQQFISGMFRRVNDKHRSRSVSPSSSHSNTIDIQGGNSINSNIRDRRQQRRLVQLTLPFAPSDDANNSSVHACRDDTLDDINDSLLDETDEAPSRDIIGNKSILDFFSRPGR